MAKREHRYRVTVDWTGNTGAGTADYRAYERSHDIRVAGKPQIAGSADPAFRGDPACWNPEELFVASLSACHKLWYLHLCAEAGITVTAYLDEAEGVMVEGGKRPGHFTEIVLHPKITIAEPGRVEDAVALHRVAHQRCFIANSVSIPVRCEPVVKVAGAPARV